MLIVEVEDVGRSQSDKFAPETAAKIEKKKVVLFACCEREFVCVFAFN